MTKTQKPETRHPAAKATLAALLGICGAISYNLLAGQDMDAVRMGRTAVSVKVEEAGTLPEIQPKPVTQQQDEQPYGNSDSMGDLIAQTINGGNQANSSELVQSIQQNLYALGLYDGLIDGQSGSKTQAAIKRFQRQKGIRADGIASSDLLARLEYARKISEAANITGSIVDSSPSIKQVQRQLVLLGYKAGPIDGVMGKATRNAIRQFEKDRNMTVTGKISPDLLAALQL